MGEPGMKTRQDGEREPLLSNELKQGVEVQVGDVVEKDCSCDLEHMLRVMPEIGQALPVKFNLVAATDPVCLVMDNTGGGHGTNDAKTVHTDALKKHDIEIIWQALRSPETNMLDLGVWISTQARVEKMHHMKRCHHDALARSAETAWESCLDQGAFSRFFETLRVVLTCIVDDQGGNEKVEDKHGVLCGDATIVDSTNEDEDEQNENTFDIPADSDDDDDSGSVASFFKSKIQSTTSTSSSLFCSSKCELFYFVFSVFLQKILRRPQAKQHCSEDCGKMHCLCTKGRMHNFSAKSWHLDHHCKGGGAVNLVVTCQTHSLPCFSTIDGAVSSKQLFTTD